MNTLGIPRALDGIAPIGVSGQRHNVEQGEICHCFHSLTVWASNLNKVTQGSRADRIVPSESRAGLSEAPGKANCPFQERSPWLPPAQVAGVSRADVSSRTGAAPSESPNEAVSGAGLAATLPPGAGDLFASHSLLVFHLASSYLARKHAERQKARSTEGTHRYSYPWSPPTGARSQTGE